MKIKYVYLTGPYDADQKANVRVEIEAANHLLECEFIPFVSHLSHIWDIIFPKPIAKWLELNCQWILKCDAVLRLPGESEIADREVAFANEHHIPVFYNFYELRRAAINMVSGE